MRRVRSARFLARRGSVPLGVVSLGADEEPGRAEVHGLYVVSEARSGGVSWRPLTADPGSVPDAVGGRVASSASPLRRPPPDAARGQEPAAAPGVPAS